ncbi:KilA-N domain-containing protein [Rhodobium gokarnense]|uniref:KilA-N domain-containing protein n=1 Tax=Rhodobium gokarnense TaxID=364296 RepID=A0ABT3HHF3_9HYPH|nr:KilA-N domain-containing protein [Rhodobium gokarnense]MCW2309739.1 hypothetical protein [Rhodobium gokarnense]
MNAIVIHPFHAARIEQRVEDGYLNATAMCKAAGKKFNDYARLDATSGFMSALSAEAGIPVSKLIQSVKGGSGPQGTWVHPKVAIHLAQWLSPEFAVWCTNVLFDWMGGKTVPVKSFNRRPPTRREPAMTAPAQQGRPKISPREFAEQIPPEALLTTAAAHMREFLEGNGSLRFVQIARACVARHMKDNDPFFYPELLNDVPRRVDRIN